LTNSAGSVASELTAFAPYDKLCLAGAGWQVADHDVDAEFVGQLLEFAFPQPHPRAVAAAAIGGDQ
jgi:hypothetical protein